MLRLLGLHLDATARDAAAARSLVDSMESMRPAMRRYKALDRVRDVSVEYLRKTIAGM
jgi:hypothetical protein